MPTVEQRRDILNRLKSVDGHLRGVLKMVEEDAYCMDVIKQLQAVQGAIGRVNALLLQDHLQTCVTTAIRGDVPSERSASSAAAAPVRAGPADPDRLRGAASAPASSAGA